MTDRNELLGLTRDLVSIPSHDDETQVGNAIEAWFAEHTDAEVARDDAGNLIARHVIDAARDGPNPDAGSASLALVGHHDVVPPDNSQVIGDDEYMVERHDDRLYGRGTADMKGALAAAMCAFRDATADGSGEDAGSEGDDSRSTAGDDLPADGDGPSIDEVVFASFVGEEQGGIGARHAIDQGFAPEYAIIGEGSTNYSGTDVTDIAVAHKGRRASSITARGESAHASEPDAGENAIYRACDAVSELETMDAPTVEIAGEKVRGSVVATEIEGGSAWNVVPDTCTVTIDERTVPGERAPLEALAGIDGIEWTIEQDLPPMRCESQAFARAVREAATTVQTGLPELVTKPHATDAGWLAEAGTACVICGPAEPGEAHTEDESVSIDVLDRCYRIYRGAIESMC